MKKRKLIETEEKSNNVMQTRVINPLTSNQKKTFTEWNNLNTYFYAIPGTGKSFLALYLALKELSHGPYEKIHIFRSAVSARDIGFLPGNTKEKIKVFETPYYEICSELFGRGDAYELLKLKHQVSFECTSFLRGITFTNSIVIIDECQNCTFQELSTLITRAGKNTRFIFCGDFRQSDLIRNNDKQGLFDMMAIIKSMPSFSFIEFDIADVVRGGLVKEFLTCENNYYANRKNGDSD